nr:ribbon-helix-helix domain-containing protein [Planktothrix prolifica]
MELETIEISEPKTQPTPQPETTFMDRLQVQPKEGTKRFTVDLPESTHRKLSMLAARTGRTKAEIVRLLLDEALENVQD